jgi:hypothetical protein
MLRLRRRSLRAFLRNRRAACYIALTLIALCDCGGRSALGQEIESVMSFSSDAEKLVFQVATHGCTRKEDFKVEMSELVPNQWTITLVRLRPDECKGFFREGTQLVFRRGDLGIPQNASIRLSNRSTGVR